MNAWDIKREAAIDSSYMTFSPELVRNSDIVWVQTNCISHPMFWNVVKYAKQYGVQLRCRGRFFSSRSLRRPGPRRSPSWSGCVSRLRRRICGTGYSQWFHPIMGLLKLSST